MGVSILKTKEVTFAELPFPTVVSALESMLYCPACACNATSCGGASGGGGVYPAA